LVPLAIIYAKKPFKRDSAGAWESTSFLWAAAQMRNSGCKLDRKSDGSRGAMSSSCLIALTAFCRGSASAPAAHRWRCAKAEKWMLERLEMTDGLGAIYPAMLNAIIALRCLGYSEDDPQVIRARDEFEKLGIEETASAAMFPKRHSACNLRFRRCGIRHRRCMRWARPVYRPPIRA
jgi:squalene-hopene/tetraprenyl-beta-curcumene cyclase